MSHKESKHTGITEKLGLMPKEQSLMVAHREGKLFIGIPKERTFDENRIGLTPDAVEVLVANGHRVIIEHDAGKMCGFFDHHYSEAGAEITKNTEEVEKHYSTAKLNMIVITFFKVYNSVIYNEKMLSDSFRRKIFLKKLLEDLVKLKLYINH